MKFKSAPPTIFEYQSCAAVELVVPTQNTWYEVLNERNVLIYGIAVRQDTTGEDLELRLTLNGEVYTATIAAVAGTSYNILFRINYDGNVYISFGASASAETRAFMVIAKDAIVEIRKTSLNGAGKLWCSVAHGKKEPI